MEFVEVAGRRYAQFDRLRARAGLLHAFSTRPTSVSARPTQEAAANRAQMAADWQFDAMRLRYCVQIHRPNIAHVTHDTPPGMLEDTDAAFTDVPAAPLMCFSADCPLVLAYDPCRRAVGVAHASWRCTVAEITRQLIERMQAELGCRAADMCAGIGPGAGPESYEVQDDVYRAASALPDREACFRHRDGRLYFDLWAANRGQLSRAGVPAENIEIAGICTMTSNDVFYSFRREGKGCGHFALLVGTR